MAGIQQKEDRVRRIAAWYRGLSYNTKLRLRTLYGTNLDVLGLAVDVIDYHKQRADEFAGFVTTSQQASSDLPLVSSTEYQQINEKLGQPVPKVLQEALRSKSSITPNPFEEHNPTPSTVAYDLDGIDGDRLVSEVFITDPVGQPQKDSAPLDVEDAMKLPAATLDAAEISTQDVMREMSRLFDVLAKSEEKKK